MQYHRRGLVSRSCSGWEGVGPTRYGRQEFCRVAVFCNRGRGCPVCSCSRCFATTGGIHALVRGVMKVWVFALRRRCFPVGEGRAHRPVVQSYRVKPHGQLVLVSSRRCRPCTPSLSTSWSRTTLQGGWTPGRSHLQASFPLRCFQRLSLPHLATRQCDWRHNRYTRDASTPVLSY